jgi:tellurite resistance protein
LNGFSVREVPIGMYGAVMGLAGLGLTARAAAPLFPGVFRAPAYFTELWVALGVLACFVLLPLYLLKLVRFPEAVKAEFTNPAQMGFCATLPVGMTLVAGGLAPYLPALALWFWWIGVVLLLAFQVWGLYRVLSGGIELAQINAGWLILFVGGIVVPGAGIALGQSEAARFLFGVSATIAPLVMALLFYRAAVGPALPEPLRPSWFIFLVPPSLIYAHGLAFYSELLFLENLFFLGVMLSVALLVYARGFLRWKFGPAWWAFTFPLDALAYAAVRYAQQHPTPVWRAVAGACLVLATLFVATVLLKSLLALAVRFRSAPSQAA